jgi:hypothetical protein
MAALGFSSNGKTIAAVGVKSTPFGKTTIDEGAELIVWDAATGTKKWSVPDSNVSQLAFSSDGKTLATYSTKVANPKLDNDGNASWQFVEPRFTFFDAATGKENAKHDIKTSGMIKSIQFLPGSDRLAVTGMHEMRQFDIRTGEMQNEIKWHPERWAFYSITFSPDGKTVARAWNDWIDAVDVATGEVEGLRKFEFPNTMFNVVFAPDLKRVACTQQGAVILDIGKLEPLPAAADTPPPSAPAKTSSPPRSATPTGTPPKTSPPAAAAAAKAKSGPGKENLTAKAKYSASSEFPGDPTLVAAKAFDGSAATRWHSKDATRSVRGSPRAGTIRSPFTRSSSTKRGTGSPISSSSGSTTRKTTGWT